MKLPLLSFGGGLLLLPFLAVTPTTLPKSPDAAAKPPRYIGASKCKSCHKGEAKGDIYETWEKSAHAKAFETLASDKAKEYGKERGVDDPQKSDKCLKCHETAFGVDKDELKRGFKHDEGVGCEVCHGPGEEHVKVRMKEALKEGAQAPVSAEEINTKIDWTLCKKCHNKESPSYKPFCFKEFMAKIRHIDPNIKRTDEELKAMKEKDDPNCEVCSKKKKSDNG